MQDELEPALGPADDSGSRSSTSETSTCALPVAHEMPIAPEDEPFADGGHDRRVRSAATTHRPATRPIDGEADSQPALEVRL